MTLQKKIDAIAQKLKKGVTPDPVRVREILDWMGVSRRGSNVNWRIRRTLEQFGLETIPDFEWAYIHGTIKFVESGSDAERETSSTTYRIDGLESANRKPISVKPDSPLTEATTIMLTNDFSQLPVMTTDCEVKGTISWKSIGSRLTLGNKCLVVRECMDPAKVVNVEASLFEAIEIITRNDYVLVQAQDKTICGIVTVSDLSQQFRDLAEPFLLIGECENLLRRLIHGKFKVEELNEAKDSEDSNRVVTGVADLTLGEYVRLLEENKRWSKLKLSVNRKEFVLRLNKVREIRNDIMHFDPQGVAPEDMQALRDFVRFLQELRRLGAI